MNNSIYIDVINRKAIRLSRSILSIAQLCEQISLEVDNDKKEKLIKEMIKYVQKKDKDNNNFEDNIQLFIDNISMDNEDFDN